MKNKRGGIAGGFISLFFATIAIALILGLFIFGSFVIEKMYKVGDGVAIYDEEAVEIDNIFSYMLRHKKMVNVNFLVEGGLSLDDAMVNSDFVEEDENEK